MPPARSRQPPGLACHFRRIASLAILLFGSAAAATPPSWTDWADLALASPSVLVVSTEKASKLSRKTAPDVPPGEIRVLVEARLTAALKAPGLLPAQAEWLWQGAPDARGRPPFAKTDPLLLFGQPVAGSTSPEVQQFRLSRPDAAQPWTPEAERIVRAILAEAALPGNAGLMVTAVSDGFHSAGTIAGASESQFFLATEAGQPATLVVQRSPGAPPQITLATGDVIDRATPVAPQSLRWRALACGLPPALPEPLATAPELVADYAAALASLGPCGRTR